jgi:hypothetical protein
MANPNFECHGAQVRGALRGNSIRYNPMGNRTPGCRVKGSLQRNLTGTARRIFAGGTIWIERTSTDVSQFSM